MASEERLEFNLRVEKKAREISAGERVLYLRGGYNVNQDFSIGTVGVDELKFENEISKGTISRQVTVEEARGCLEKPNLTNKNTLESLLGIIDNS